MRKKLTGKVVTIQQHGWSDIHNDPIVATSVTVNGESFFHDATYPGTMAKTPEGCKDMLLESINDAEDNYGYTVKSVVTDNAENMQKRRSLIADNEPEMLTYGCLAHWLNLLGQNIIPSGLMTHIKNVNKYYCNHQIAGTLLFEQQGSVKSNSSCQGKHGGRASSLV